MPDRECDTIFYNAKVVTVDDNFSLADGVAITNGRFVKVGANDEVLALAGAGTVKVDLAGSTVVPGFVDTHPHVLVSGDRTVGTLSLAGATSIESVKKLIADAVKDASPGDWILTSALGEPPDYFGLPELLDEQRWPTRWDLDEVAPDNPVRISPTFERDQPTILNSRALEMLGVTAATPSLVGDVTVGRDPDSGRPNGHLHGMHLWSSSPLYKKLMSLMPRLAADKRLAGLKAAMKRFNSAGVTAGFEGHGMTPAHSLVYKNLWSRDELTMRVWVSYEVNTSQAIEDIEAWMKNLPHATGSGFGDDRLMFCGVTASIDGPIQLGRALMNEPYEGPDGEPADGLQKVSADKLRQICLLAAQNDLRMSIQAAGDKAIDIALDVCEAVNEDIPISDRRWALLHVQHPSKVNIERCSALGLAVTTYTSAEFSKGAAVYVDRLGDDRWMRIMPMRDWLDADVVACQSTDGKHYEPMFTIWQSLKRVDGLDGKSMMTPAKLITREEALRIYTINGARLLFADKDIGSIEPGKRADLVVLDNDVLTCPLDEIRDIEVLQTVFGGEVIYARE